MRIEEEVKLDYSDVLFRPKRSTLKSRKEVDLTRTYKFKHSNREWAGIPIIASNTFHLKDYFSNNEISFYTPDDSNSLAEKIEEISSNNNFYKMKAYSALKK